MITSLSRLADKVRLIKAARPKKSATEQLRDFGLLQIFAAGFLTVVNAVMLLGVIGDATKATTPLLQAMISEPSKENAIAAYAQYVTSQVTTATFSLVSVYAGICLVATFCLATMRPGRRGLIGWLPVLAAFPNIPIHVVSWTSDMLIDTASEADPLNTAVHAVIRATAEIHHVGLVDQLFGAAMLGCLIVGHCLTIHMSEKEQAQAAASLETNSLAPYTHA